MRTLVVGIGNRQRGDDGAGPAVAARVAELSIPGVRVLVEEEPIALLEHFRTHDEVIVVDAVRSTGDAVGVRTWVVGPQPLPRNERPIGSHGLGVGEVIELARALDELPSRLAVVGVGAHNFQAGASLTAQVEDRLDDAVRHVVDYISRPRTLDAASAIAKTDPASRLR